MALEALSTISGLPSLASMSADYLTNNLSVDKNAAGESGSFGTILQSAVDMLNETNDLQNKAEQAEIQFALGNSTSTHELKIAEEKASLALQYTVAVRDKFLESYKEIMQMQI
ncbi:hypothetical protein FACS1894111_02370 [Clostridia bacterium]|nr:hypothetical protein FACS1894111_02370 [Clostridia bacterium]